MFFSAILVAIFHQWLHIEKDMPNESIIKQAKISGNIISLPIKSPSKTQFQFAIDSINNHKAKAVIFISCYKDCPEFIVNQRWEIIANLQKPHNLANPGGFDYVGWLNSRHISWIGSGKLFRQLKTKNANQYSLLNFRNKIAVNLNKLNLDNKALGVFQALSLGITSKLDKSDWDLFRRTGTTHLMVISGAHIGFVAGLFFYIIRAVWSRIEFLCLRFPAQKAASIVAIMMALSYSLLAGFTVSVKRAFIASLFVLSRNFLKYKYSSWQAWRYAILVILLIEPHAVLFPGFYLSFIAVAILITMNKYILSQGIKKTILIQIACLFGLMPFTLYWFAYGAINGFFANIVAIPLVGFIIVPLSLLTMVICQWFDVPWLLDILKINIKLLLLFLEKIDSFAYINLVINYNNFLKPLALVLTIGLILFLPIIAFRIPTILLFCIGIFPKQDNIKFGEAKIDILDVGQGLSILVRTNHHQLIYDTGMKFFKGTDMAQLAIIPYLKTLNIKKIDKIVISHPDLDHRGGLNSLEQAYKIDELIVDNPGFYKRGVNCHAYQDWAWDGVTFHFFKLANTKFKKNNSSCVLQIKNTKVAILLTGDIEQKAENYLVNNYTNALQSKFLVVPHHGSKTSSSLSFLNQVKPEFGLISFGFNNKYHFPHDRALQNYKDSSIKIFNTLDCGMISITLSNNSNYDYKPMCQNNRLLA